MSRFRKFYSGKKRRSSRVVKMKFQSFVDISTQADNMQIISVNAGGNNVLKRLLPFFSAYKYYKLGGVSIKLIPASTLPVDPTGLSYEAGENTVDPRDQLTPGMCRITNGEDILEDITGLTGDQQRQLYDNMLLDPRWYKWMLQSGVKRFGKPRYWQVGQLHQDKYPGATINYPIHNSDGKIVETGTFQANGNSLSVEGNGDLSGSWYQPLSSHYGLFQTGHRGVLGWMPTDGLQRLFRTTENGSDVDTPLLASIPEVELFKILMPPMHKTNYYYRMFITETVFFREPIVMNINGYRPVDVFHTSSAPVPLSPKTLSAIVTDASINASTGGNDGRD